MKFRYLFSSENLSKVWFGESKVCFLVFGKVISSFCWSLEALVRVIMLVVVGAVSLLKCDNSSMVCCLAAAEG